MCVPLEVLEKGSAAYENLFRRIIKEIIEPKSYEEGWSPKST